MAKELGVGLTGFTSFGAAEGALNQALIFIDGV